MKKTLSSLLTIVLWFLAPGIIFAQAPNLGTAANFVLFSTDGAVTNTGTSHFTGKVGTNNGANTGFGNVNGGMHEADGTTAQCATDLLAAYNELDSIIPTDTLAPSLGNGDTLIAGVYTIAGASTLTLDLILDGQGDTAAVFIFQIEGAFSTNASSKVKLINGAQACNVFWKIEGLLDMATETTMRGTIIVNNAGINMNTGDTLEGRVLTTAGAITADGVLAYTPIGCGSPTLTGPTAPTLGEAGCYGIFSTDGPVVNSGITNVMGDVGANVGLTTGYDSLLVTGNIHFIPDGSTAQAGADLLIAYNYLNGLAHDIELLYPAQFGANLVLTPHTYLLDAATTFTDTLYLNGQENANAVFVIKIYGALSTSTHSKVVLTNGTQAKNVYWLINGAVEISDSSVFNGTIISQGAINLFTGTTIYGSVFTGVGAIETNAINSAGNIPSDCETVVGGDTSTTATNEVKRNQMLVTIYPNPFRTSTTIRMNDVSQIKTSALSIYNAVGDEIMNIRITQEYTTLETGGLPSGIYYYRITSTDKTIQSGKLISQP